MRNKTILALTSGVLAVQLLLPMAAVAQNGAGDNMPEKQPRGQQVKENLVTRVCDALEQQADRIVGKYDQQKNRLEERRDRRNGALATHRDDRSNRLAEIRGNYDARHEERIGLMLEKAGSDEAKQAILEFQQAVKDALVARRAAYDAAIADYRSGVDAAVAERRATIDAAATALQSAIDTAVATAQAACAGEEPDLKSIRHTLRAALQEARADYKEAIKNVPDYRATVKALIETRKAAFQAAKDQFRTAVEAARDVLKVKLVELQPSDQESLPTEE